MNGDVVRVATAAGGIHQGFIENNSAAVIAKRAYKKGGHKGMKKKHGGKKHRGGKTMSHGASSRIVQPASASTTLFYDTFF